MKRSRSRQTPISSVMPLIRPTRIQSRNCPVTLATSTYGLIPSNPTMKTVILAFTLIYFSWRVWVSDQTDLLLSAPSEYAG